MSDITKLLERYLAVAHEATNRDPNNSRIATMLKKHIREFARTGGLNGQPLHPANQMRADEPCPHGWQLCPDGNCVPIEIGCEGETTGSPA